MFKVGDRVIVNANKNHHEDEAMHGTIEYVREIEGIYLYYVGVDEYHGLQMLTTERDLELVDNEHNEHGGEG